MSVSVANNDSNISGKTIVLAERDVTITGQHTFDRDPSAPFAVTPNSAVVANLNAEFLNGFNGEQIVYTPTFNGTVGDGSISGAYWKVGDFVHFEIYFQAGTTTVFPSGTLLFGLPVTDATGINIPVGVGTCNDVGVGLYPTLVIVASSTTVFLLLTSVDNAAVSNTFPATWVNGDSFALSGHYLAA